MLTLGPIAFTAPWLLAGLLALPVLWLLLRVVPPAPVLRRFPGVALLLGLKDDETQSDKTPWWLLLLRTLAIAALILAFAGPVLNPQKGEPGRGPLLVVLDGSWADARDWQPRLDRVAALLTDAGRAGRTVAVVQATDLPAGPLAFLSPDVWTSRLGGLEPEAWEPDAAALADWAAAQEGGFDTYWLSDGLARDGRDAALAALESHGTVTVFESPRPVYGLRPATADGGTLTLTAIRARTAGAAEVTVVARGPDPSGVERDLATAVASFADGAAEASAALDLPPELRNRVTRFEIAGIRSAGAISLTDDALRRREVALIAGRDDREGLELLSPLHYLHQALAPSADLLTAPLEQVLPANPDVIVLADVARVTDAESEALTKWIEGGGLLLRFAGPRLAASDVSVEAEDPLMPVRLRAGGRSVGGAMSWGEPKTLRPFDEDSPFHGLPVPDEVSVTAQVLAQPDPDLAERTIASLADGTPLVTRKRIGDGRVVLFHVTANADWSSLPLSGLFVQMLDRLAVSSRAGLPSAEALEGTTWTAAEVMDGFGRLGRADALPGVPGPDLAAGKLGPTLQPGLYTSEDRRFALNVIRADTVLTPMVWPDRIRVEGLSVPAETRLTGALLTLALMLAALDVLASLAISGKLGLGALRGGRRGGAAAAVLLAAALAALAPGASRAQTAAEAPAATPPAALDPEAEAFAIAATREVALAHVRTGNPQVDDVAQAGLTGLSEILFNRTSIEPGEAMEVDLETDELAFFPFLYWPVTPDQPIPSSEAYAKLNTYLRNGGLILFDTRDADIAAPGTDTQNRRKLQQLARPLDIPPLEPIPPDHVLTRTFYLLQDFPGRYAGRDLWVEAAPEDAEQAEGMPFRNLNDGVTPVVIGANDWAAAWAVDGQGIPRFPVGRGYAGERQRELAYRFGVNLIMNVLTGNYKSDQVHVPALLERLGQ